MLEPCSNTFYELLYNGNQEDSTPPKATLLLRQKLAVKALEEAYGMSWEKQLEYCEGDYESLFEELQELEESDKIMSLAEEIHHEAYETGEI